MGSISLIRKKQEVVGGSAYKNKKFGKGEKAPSEVVREGTGKVYALKSILLTKVSVRLLIEDYITKI